MNTFLSIVNWIVANYQTVITGLIGILTGLMGICMLIPGDQPEKTLQAIVDFLTKFSKK